MIVMITANVYHRTSRIKYGDSHGTCFTIDVEGRQYLITAKHLVEGISPSDTVEVFYNNRWRPMAVTLVGEAPSEADITVLAPSVRLSPDIPLPSTNAGIVYAQDVYFLGYPYNLFADIGEVNRNFPMPFVKKAILSSMSKTAEGIERLFLDGHNNPGFSGGPVVWTQAGKNDYSVAGVVSGFQSVNEPVYDGTTPTTLAYRYNTGIIIAYGIQHAIAVIESNPIGLELMRNEDKPYR
jgi:hypothetical protein